MNHDFSDHDNVIVLMVGNKEDLVVVVNLISFLVAIKSNSDYFMISVLNNWTIVSVNDDQNLDKLTLKADKKEEKIVLYCDHIPNLYSFNN